MENQQFNQEQYNNGTNNQTNNQSAPDYILWLILGIVQILTLCCCNCFTFIFGILTVVFVCMANNFYKSGNINNYTAKMKTAKIFNLIGWACILISVLLNIILGVFDIVANTISSSALMY